MVLCGGPDRERPVSLESGAQVAEALRQAGHAATCHDVGPADLSALDAWVQKPGDVVFPVLHGSWGEGGPLQALLDARGIRYVGCEVEAAALCMDKHRTKLALVEHNIPTPAFECIERGVGPTLGAPLVIKPLCEGSSIDLAICHDESQVSEAYERLANSPRNHPRNYPRLLIERFVGGKEFTVGVIGPRGQERALPPVHIVPAGAFYDYEAKYHRDDTRYVLDPSQMGVASGVIDALGRVAVEAHCALGCRHLSRVDFIVDEAGRLWVLEVNTIPGFTTHSLLPMAAAHAGLSLPQLVDGLVRLAMDER